MTKLSVGFPKRLAPRSLRAVTCGRTGIMKLTDGFRNTPKEGQLTSPSVVFSTRSKCKKNGRSIGDVVV